MQCDDPPHQVILAIQRAFEALPAGSSGVLPHEFDSVKTLNDLFPDGGLLFLL